MRLYWAITISLLIHLMFRVGVDQFRPSSVSKRDNIEVELVPYSKPQQNADVKSFVKDLPTPNEVKTPSSKIRFWSLQNKFVKEEQRVENIGLTQNKLQAASTPQKKTPQPKEPSESTDGIAQANRELKQISQGASAISQELPKDIKVGAFTSLNTQYNSNYTFFARIEDLIYVRWVERIQRAFDILEGRNLPYNRDNMWITDVDIILDKKGFYQKTLILKSSQVGFFDEAIKDSFQEVSFFPNPPQSLVEEDGFIHLKYKFNVKYEPRRVVSK